MLTDRIANLSVLELFALVFGVTAAFAFLLHSIVLIFARGKCFQPFKLVSPLMIPLLAPLFALIVGFLAAEVWSINAKAQSALSLEASALQRALLISKQLSIADQNKVRIAINQYVENVRDQDWPSMHQRTLYIAIPDAISDQLIGLEFSIHPNNHGQQIALTEISRSIDQALDARNERIQVSHLSVNMVKWFTVFGIGVLLLLITSILHIESRGAAFISMGVVCLAITMAVVLIATHTRPYTGSIAIGPELLTNLLQSK